MGRYTSSFEYVPMDLTPDLQRRTFEKIYRKWFFMRVIDRLNKKILIHKWKFKFLMIMKYIFAAIVIGFLFMLFCFANLFCYAWHLEPWEKTWEEFRDTNTQSL